MAGEQDIVALGINVDSFDNAKLKRIKEFISVFNDLSKYDGKIFNPVMGDGLTTFNKSIQETSRLIDSMNSKLGLLASSAANTSNSFKNVSKDSKVLDSNTKEYNKTVQDTVKNQSKIAISTAAITKENAALKVQLAEVKRALLEEAKANNESYQARIKAIEAEKKQQQSSKDLAIQQKKAAKEVADEQKRASKEAIARIKAEEAELKRQQKEVELLNNKYQQLKNTLASQKQTAANNLLTYGENDPRTKLSLETLSTTQKQFDKISLNIKDAESNANAFGRSLTKGLSTLRLMAYILPGIGLAGIFNLAFEAIGDVLQSMGYFVDKEKEAEERTKSLTKAIDELSKAYSDLTDNAERFNKLSVKAIENEIEKNKAAGFSQDKLLRKNITLAEKNVSVDKIGRQDDVLATIKEYNIELDVQSKKVNDIAESLRIVEKKGFSNDFLNKAVKKQDRILPTKEDFDKQVESLSKEFEKEQKQYANLKDTLDAYYSKVQALDVARAEYQKFQADEARRLIVETTKENIALEVQKNNAIISSDKTTQEEKIKGILKVLKLEKQVNLIDAANVYGTGFKGKDPNEFGIIGNNSSTPTDIDIARNKKTTEDKKSLIKSSEDTEKVLIEFYQRYIKASGEYSKAELEQEAIAQEKIANNENKSLDERLKAYSNYLSSKQQIQDLENNIDIQRGQLSPFSNNSLTIEEELEIERKTLTQKANIQADAEKKIYDIVSTSLNKELKLIKDNGNLEYDENNKNYLKELILLNKFFDKKIISLKEYQTKRKAIDEKFRISGLDSQILRDENLVFALEQKIRKLSSKDIYSDSKVKSAEIGVALAGGGIGDKLQADKNLAIQIGDNKAINDAIFNARQELDNALISLDEDRVKRAKANLDKELENEIAANKKKAENIKAFEIIETAILDAVKTLGDAIYQERLRKLELQKQIIDEGLQAELNAVEKSSLSQKNKAALEVQLAEQKKVNDRNAAVEERKIKREQAVFDKAIAIVKIIAGTAVAVVSHLSIPILAAAYAAAGAIELATVAATPIPYKFGTPPEGHKGGLAEYGEAGPEVVKEPGKNPYIVTSRTISQLPKGTHVIPIEPSTVFSSKDNNDDSWDKIHYLGNEIKKSKQEIKNIFKPVINIDTNRMAFRNSILGR